MQRFLSFFFLLILSSHFLQAQANKPNYSLLWEVSGNNLPAPSYLFGTMHVRDQRAAEFPDSVLLALEQTQAYAMEIHPDTLVAFMMELMFQTSEDNVLKDRLSEDAYKQLNEAVLKKTGKPIDSLENQDPTFIEFLLMDFEEPDYTDKNTQIVDLYLYKMAWLMGKKTFGLEELKDYQNVEDKFFQTFEKGTEAWGDSANKEAVNEQYETMLQIYQSGDIFALEKWLTGQTTDQEFEAAILDTRNTKMVRSLEGLAKIHPTFFAVGAAHLPGKNGMIELLEKAGYQVRQVGATFTGYAKNFKPKGEGPKWHVIKNESLGYEVQTASPPFDFGKLLADKEMPADLTMDMNIQMDMFDMNAFFMMNMNLPSDRKKDLTLENMAKIAIAQNGGDNLELRSQKAITHQEVEGGEFKFVSEDEGYSLWRIFIREKTVHVFGVFREDDDFTSANITKFYESVRFFEPTISVSSFKEHRLEAGAYSVKMPGNLNYRRVNRTVQNQKGGERNSIAYQYQAVDKLNEVFYIMQHSYIPLGNTVEDELQLLEHGLANVANKWGKPVSDPELITYKGYKGMEAEFSIKGQSLFIRQVLRGNRLYVQLIGGDLKKEDQKIKTFYNSLEFLPEGTVPLETIEIPEINAKINFPIGFQLDKKFIPDESEEYPKVDEWEIGGLDTLNGTNYIVYYYEYPLYHEFMEPAEFNKLYKESLAETESIIRLSDTLFRGEKAWYIEYQAANKGITHSLLFFDRNRNFELNVYAPLGRADTKAWAFFNSFQSNVEGGADYLFSDRSETLLTNIQSRDTTIQLAAKEGIDRYELGIKNLPSIYRILEKDFPFDTIYTPTIHELLYQELLYTNDETTLPFLEKLYAYKANDEEAQVSILETLAKLKNKKAYDLYFKLIPNFSQQKFTGYNYNAIIAPLRDTMALAAIYYPQILNLRKNEALRYYSYNLIFNLLQKEAIDPQIVAKNRDLFLRDAQAIVKEYNLMSPQDALPEIDIFWHLDALHIILGELPPDKNTQQYLSSLLEIPNPKLVTTVIDALLMQGQSIPTSSFEKVFDQPYYWYGLLKNLKFEDNLDKVPTELLTQKNTVTAYVYNYLEGNFADLTSFNILEKRNFDDGEDQYNMYLYTFKMTGYDETYFGVVSQPTALKEIDVFPDYFDYTNKAFSQEKMEETYEGMIKNWKE